MVEKNILGLFFLTFIAVLVPKAYSNEKLVQTASLQDLRVAINSGDVFNLDNFFEGYNLTYALEGEFSNNMTQSAPAVSKKIELAALTAKASETVPNNNFQDLYADPVDQNSFYVIEDRNFTIWQVNDLIPSVLTSFMMPFASNIVSAIPIAAAGTVYMPVIQSSPNGFMASLVNVTSKDDIQNMESMSLVVNAPGTIEGANVYSNYDSIFYFLIVLAKENQIYIVHYDLVAMQVQLFNIITPAQIGSQLFSPINVVFDGYNGLICDSTDGIYQFSAIEYLYTANQTLVITEFFQDTQDFGELFSCRLENSYLSIGTSSGIALYGSASLNYIKKLARYQRPYESYILNNVVRLGIIEGELFSGYYVSNTTTSFRISVLNTQNDEDLVFDIPTYELFGNDSMIDPTPPYMILNPHESDALLIIFSTPNSI